MPQKAPRELPRNYMHKDEKPRIKALVKKIRGESRYLTSLYVNSQGKVIINVTDPQLEESPFVVRDEAEWLERRPVKKKREDEEEVRAEA